MNLPATEMNYVNVTRDWPRPLLRLEGAAVLVAAVFLYFQQGYGWLPFVLALLLPDLAALVYLVDRRAGSTAYNLVHTYTAPLLLLLAGLLLNWSLALPAGLIWLAHIGMDRMVGYGLKYSGQFKETHLQRV